MKSFFTLSLFILIACNSRQEKKDALVDKQKWTKTLIDTRKRFLENTNNKIVHLNKMFEITTESSYLNSAISLIPEQSKLEWQIDSLQREFDNLEFELKKY